MTADLAALNRLLAVFGRPPAPEHPDRCEFLLPAGRECRNPARPDMPLCHIHGRYWTDPDRRT